MVGGPCKSPSGGRAPLSVYFAMARGADRGRGSCGHAHHARDSGVRAPEITKWFGPNYRYMVSEFKLGKRLRVASYNAGRLRASATSASLPTAGALSVSLDERGGGSQEGKEFLRDACDRISEWRIARLGLISIARLPSVELTGGSPRGAPSIHAPRRGDARMSRCCLPKFSRCAWSLPSNGSPIDFDGGRTWARTLDPLIKRRRFGRHFRR
jgi:hypothetical protein